MKKISEEDRTFLKEYDADKYEHPSVAVDMLVFTTDMPYKLELLLIKRGNHPYKHCWAIPGGFVGKYESLDGAAKRKLMEETSIGNVHMEQLYTFGKVNRDPRTRVISTAYMALVPKNKLKVQAGNNVADAMWFGVSLQEGKVKFEKDISLAFDHEEIIEMAVARLQGKLSYTDIALNLIRDQERFTIFELQQIHESILNKKLDTSNFRRYFKNRYLDRGAVKETGEKCMEFGHRPSKYYKICDDSCLL